MFPIYVGIPLKSRPYMKSFTAQIVFPFRIQRELVALSGWNKIGNYTLQIPLGGRRSLQITTHDLHSIRSVLSVSNFFLSRNYLCNVKLHLIKSLKGVLGFPFNSVWVFKSQMTESLYSTDVKQFLKTRNLWEAGAWHLCFCSLKCLFCAMCCPCRHCAFKTRYLFH